MDNYIVYKHTCKLNKKVYIGITSQLPEKRWKNGNAYKSNFEFYTDILKYKWDSGFSHEILYRGLSKTNALRIELDLIESLKTNQFQYGYNQTNKPIMKQLKGIKEKDSNKTLFNIPCYNNNLYKFAALNIKTGIKTEFLSLKEAIKFFECDKRSLENAINKIQIFKDHLIIRI